MEGCRSEKESFVAVLHQLLFIPASATHSFFNVRGFLQKKVCKALDTSEHLVLLSKTVVYNLQVFSLQSEISQHMKNILASNLVEKPKCQTHILYQPSM